MPLGFACHNQPSYAQVCYLPLAPPAVTTDCNTMVNGYDDNMIVFLTSLSSAIPTMKQRSGKSVNLDE